MLDYKFSLWGVDRESEKYKETMSQVRIVLNEGHSMVSILQQHWNFYIQVSFECRFIKGVLYVC